MLDITKKVAKKGDQVKLFINGKEFEGTVIATSCVTWQREYCIQFKDGSKEWVLDRAFECLKN